MALPGGMAKAPGVIHLFLCPAVAPGLFFAYDGTSDGKSPLHRSKDVPPLPVQAAGSLKIKARRKGKNMFCNGCNSSLWIIILIIILFGCGGNSWGCGNNCGCGCENNNNCGCGC